MTQESFNKIDNDWRRRDTLEVKGEFGDWTESVHKHPTMVPLQLVMRNIYRIKPSEEE